MAHLYGPVGRRVQVILLDTRNRLIAISKVYRGSLNASQVRVGELFKEAVRRNAARIFQ